MSRFGPPILAAALALSAVACRPADRGEGETPLAQELRPRQAIQVRTTPVVRREMVRTLSTTTTIESTHQIELVPRVAGVVTGVAVEEGDRVAEKAVLATLDPRDAEASLAEAEEALVEAQGTRPRLELAVAEAAEQVARAKLAWDQARSEVERNETTGLLSAIDLDKLRLARDTAERDWEAAKLAHRGAEHDLEQQATTIARAQLTVDRRELELSYTEITAPFDGVIAERKVRVGDSVTAGAAAFTLTDPDSLRCVVHRPQRELAFFRSAHARGTNGGGGEGIEITVVPEAHPEASYTGTIAILSPTIDPESGSFRLTIDLTQPPAGDLRPRLLPGMLVRLEIVTERHPDALVVPKRALRREGDRHFLFVDTGGQAARIEVGEGFADSDSVEVLPVEEGVLEAGDAVVVVGNRDLEDGSEIESEEPAEAPEDAAATAQEAPVTAADDSAEGGADDEAN